MSISTGIIMVVCVCEGRGGCDVHQYRCNHGCVCVKGGEDVMSISTGVIMVVCVCEGRGGCDVHQYRYNHGCVCV